MQNVLEYIEGNISFKVSQKDLITFYGEKNKSIVENLMFKNSNNFVKINEEVISSKNIDKLRDNVRFVSIEYIDIFNSETIMDELSFPLENLAMDKKTMKERVESVSRRFGFKKINTSSPLLLDVSTKVMLQIASALITEPKVLVLDNVLSLLDKDDRQIVFEVINNYINDGGALLNFTSNIEESLLGNKMIITGNDKILIEGETLSVLNEERIMKRLGFSLPFIVMLSKYLKDYELIDKYYFDYKSLGGALWK